MRPTHGYGAAPPVPDAPHPERNTSQDSLRLEIRPTAPRAGERPAMVYDQEPIVPDGDATTISAREDIEEVARALIVRDAGRRRPWLS